MSEELVIFEHKAFTALSTPEYSKMIREIEQNAVEIQKTTNLFQKTQSQFMDNMLTVSHLTPFRNVRQILAEMKKTRQALGEAYFNIEKKKIEKERKLNEIEICKEPLTTKLLEVEVAEIDWQIQCIMENVGGAIRKLANYTEQYNSVIKQLPSLDEKTFEEQEEAYHIMKAFEQGITAARSRGGMIDEGNLIYLTQVGINGTQGQIEITRYLQTEMELVKVGAEPTHDMQLTWLQEMVYKFKGCSEKFAEWKGMTVKTDKALLTERI